MTQTWIDYAIISVNDNPEYTGLKPYIKSRWNTLGIKTCYIHYTHDHSIKFSISVPKEVDSFGNLEVTIIGDLEAPWYLCRNFLLMISRFTVATMDIFEDKRLVISDGDLYPINSLYINYPSYNLHPDFTNIGIEYKVSNRNTIVTTCIYPEGNPLATFTYGLGSTFKSIFNVDQIDDCSLGKQEAIINSVMLDAGKVASKIGRMYLTDEDYMGYLYDHMDSPIIKLTNRKWIESVQEMNNLYDYQIDLLRSPMDLCPFIEFHNMRTSTMKLNSRWDKLNRLLEQYDTFDITPSNWFYESIDSPWRDTMITKRGNLILGCEYDETYQKL